MLMRSSREGENTPDGERLALDRRPIHGRSLGSRQRVEADIEQTLQRGRRAGIGCLPVACVRHQLLEEEGIAPGRVDDAVSRLLRHLEGRHVGEHVDALGRGQRPECQRRGTSGPVCVRLDELGSRDAHDQHGRCAELVGDPIDELEQRRVGPVDVLEDEHEGPDGRQARQHRTERPSWLGSREALLQAEGHGGSSRGTGVDACVWRLIVGRTLADHGLEHLAQRRERQGVTGRSAATDQNPGRGPHGSRELPHEPRFPDARLAEQRHELQHGVATCAVERLAQHAQLALAADERSVRRGGYRGRTLLQRQHAMVTSDELGAHRVTDESDGRLVEQSIPGGCATREPSGLADTVAQDHSTGGDRLSGAHTDVHPESSEIDRSPRGGERCVLPRHGDAEEALCLAVAQPLQLPAVALVRDAGTRLEAVETPPLDLDVSADRLLARHDAGHAASHGARGRRVRRWRSDARERLVAENGGLERVQVREMARLRTRRPTRRARHETR